MKSYALLFPGQGSQYVGMGESFFSTSHARLFEEADDALGFSLKHLMFNGPLDELTATAIAQPAILLHSIVAFTSLREQFNPTISCALGHSLGEYSALVAAEVLSLTDALKAVHMRGKLMQEAVPRGHGAMAAVLGMDAKNIVDALEEFSDENNPEFASCANFNGPMQTVIAGTAQGIKKASEKLKSIGARRIVELPVSAPFHCALMKPVQKKMSMILSSIPFNTARFPIISNVSAQPETDGDRFRALLLEQIASPVRFTDCIATINQQSLRGDGYLEVGPKNALSGIVKKIEEDCSTLNVDTAHDVAGFLNERV